MRSDDLKSPIAGADQGRDQGEGSGSLDSGRYSASLEGSSRGSSVVANNVRKIREALMMSKAELARKAGLSTLTVDRIEAGRPCRLDTKRKVLMALGLKVSDRERVFEAGAGVFAPQALVPSDRVQRS